MITVIRAGPSRRAGHDIVVCHESAKQRLVILAIKENTMSLEFGIPNSDLQKFSDEDLLTACIWAESRSQPEDGQEAVCNVILNRVRKKMRPTIRDVILQPKQFSWTDPEDPNFKKAFTAKIDDPTHWQRANAISKTALIGTLKDNTRNADHYLNVEATRKDRGGTLPKWAEDGINNHKITVTIGDHTFLNLLGGDEGKITGNFYLNVICKHASFGSARCVNDLNLLEDVTRQRVEAIIADAKKLGTELEAFETYRSQERQQQLFNQGATRLRQVGVHHYGLACDLVKVINGEPSWKGDFSFLGQLAQTHGLIWGGNWGTPNVQHSFVDSVHVQRCSIRRQPALFSDGWYTDENYDPNQD
jgi:spore germination cell wall hydrolase CwlJ-like protein